MPEDSEFHKYVLDISKRIAKFTKDYVGIPFNNSNQLPFSIDKTSAKKNSRFYSTTRKWQRGDPVIGFYTAGTGHKKMILNLPDGSSMLDLTFPGWEVAVLDASSMDHFFSRRYMFGDLHGHFLSGKPVRHPASAPPQAETCTPQSQQRGSRTDPISDNDLITRRLETLKKRQRSLEQAIHDQQARGVPFDTHPMLPPGDAASPDTIAQRATKTGPVNLKSLDEAINQEQPRTTDARQVRKIVVASQSTRDNSGVSRNRLVVRKEYSNGEVEISEKSNEGDVNDNPLSDGWSDTMAAQLFQLSTGGPKPIASAEPEGSEHEKTA